jgi:hypothetical protein
VRRAIKSHTPEGFIALDNSALIYPPTEAAFSTNTFRLSVDLGVEVNTEILRQAAHELLDRCPYAKVRLRTGFFWHYLSPNEAEIPIWEEGSYPAGRFDFKGNNHYLLKIIHGPRRIAIECFHALTDGSGALAYFKLLLARYCALASIGDGTFADGLCYTSRPEETEFSDPFQELYDRTIRPFPSVSRAYHRKGEGGRSEAVKVIRAQVAVGEIKRRAKARSLTIGEYLSAVYLMSLQELQAQEGKEGRRRRPIRLSVPVNLRRIFARETMRNFTLFVLVSIDPALGWYSFDEIAGQVRLQMAQAVEQKQLLSQIRRNVGGERSAALRFAPTILKNPLFKLLSDTLGDQQYSGVISNLGLVSFPAALSPLVEAMDFHLSPGLVNPVSIAVVGYHDSLAINFTSYEDYDTALERLFCTFLVEDGIAVSVASNRGV